MKRGSVRCDLAGKLYRTIRHAKTVQSVLSKARHG